MIPVYQLSLTRAGFKAYIVDPYEILSSPTKMCSSSESIGRLLKPISLERVCITRQNPLRFLTSDESSSLPFEVGKWYKGIWQFRVGRYREMLVVNPFEAYSERTTSLGRCIKCKSG
jgi:hypothetical protein